MTDAEILELWQRLNNEVFRPDADRDTPMIVQFARALLAEREPCLHVRLLNDTCEDCGAKFLFI